MTQRREPKTLPLIVTDDEPEPKPDPVEAIMAAGGVVMTQHDTAAEGNTRPPPSEGDRSTRSRSWFVTWNHPDTPLTQLTQQIEGLDQWVGQVERGESGTEHLQFVMRFKNARTFNSVKSALPQAHIEVCRDWVAAVRYCTKESTRVDGPWASHEHLIPKPSYKWEIEPRRRIVKSWQEELERELLETKPHPRTIIWYVDRIGGAGKTEFCAYFCQTYDGAYMVAGSIKDAMYTLARNWMKRPGEESEDFDRPLGDVGLRVVFYDIPRAQGDKVSYSGIESIKNGIITNTKYRSQTFIVNIPHVVVMSNYEPDRRMLSEDRWDIRYLDDGESHTF